MQSKTINIRYFWQHFWQPILVANLAAGGKTTKIDTEVLFKFLAFGQLRILGDTTFTHHLHTTFTYLWNDDGILLLQKHIEKMREWGRRFHSILSISKVENLNSSTIASLLGI